MPKVNELVEKEVKLDKKVKEVKEDFVTKKVFDKFSDDIKSMLTVFTKKYTTDIVTEAIKQDVPPEAQIEQASASTLSGDAIKDEAFMNEPVTIEVHPSTNMEDPKVVRPSVNGKHQPIMRGVPITVRRMFVEALARCSNTEYQMPLGPVEHAQDLHPFSAVAYPFSIVEDRNPNGRAWITNLLAEARG